MALREGSVLERILALVDDWWVAAAGIAFIVGSDFKFRTRPPGQALGGGIDSAVLLELALYSAVGCYLFIARFRVPRPRKVPLPLYLVACFVGLAILSVSYTPYPQYALVRCLQVTILLAVIVIASMDAERAHFHRFAHAYLVLIAVSVVYGFLVPSKPINNIQAGRFTWLAIHPTVSGAMMCIATVLVVGYLIGSGRERTGPHWPTVVYWVLLAIVAGGGLAAQTRGAILGAIGGVAVVVLTSRRGRALIEMALICLVLLLGVGLAASGQITSYFQRGENAKELTSLNNRTELWDLAVKAIKEKPVFGHGITSSRGIFFSEIGLGGGHNAAINVLVELGIFGFLVWIAAVLSLLFGIRRLPRDGPLNLALDRSMLLGVMTFLMIDAIFFEGAGAVGNVASTWFFMCIGWYVVARRGARRAAPTSPSAPGPRLSVVR